MSDGTDENGIKRGPGGLFQPGTAPGPGRPVGLPRSQYRTWSAALTDMRDDALVQLQQKLDEGSWDAISYILDRTISKNRTYKLGNLAPSTVASMLANGEMSPEARDLASAIGKLIEVAQIEEIKAKLDALEKRINKTDADI